VPAGFSTVIKQLVVTNTTGSAATFTFYIGDAVAGNALFSATSVGANDTVIINLSQVLQSNEVLRALASANSTLNLTVSGVENDGPLEPSANFIANDSVTVNKIADGSVTSAKIADLNVTTSKLANNSVSQLKVADGSIVNRFATTTARDAAFGGVGEPTLAEGMTAYIDADNSIYTYDGSNWVKMVSASQPAGLWKVAEFSATSGTQLVCNNAFNNDFLNYRVLINLRTSGAGGSVTFQLGSSNTQYRYGVLEIRTIGSGTNQYGSGITSTSSAVIGPRFEPGNQSSASMDIFAPNIAQQTTWSLNSMTTIGDNGTGPFVGGGWHVSSVAYSDITFFLTAGAIVEMNVRVYGYRN
jgi:hypothetical protein